MRLRIASHRILTLLLLMCAVCDCLAQTVTVSSTTLSYGNQVIGTSSAAKNVTLKNGQRVPLVITNIASNLSAYTLSTTCPTSPSTLAAGASRTIATTFTPAALGAA